MTAAQCAKWCERAAQSTEAVALRGPLLRGPQEGRPDCQKYRHVKWVRSWVRRQEVDMLNVGGTIGTVTARPTSIQLANVTSDGETTPTVFRHQVRVRSSLCALLVSTLPETRPCGRVLRVIGTGLLPPSVCSAKAQQTRTRHAPASSEQVRPISGPGTDGQLPPADAKRMCVNVLGRGEASPPGSNSATRTTHVRPTVRIVRESTGPADCM